MTGHNYTLQSAQGFGLFYEKMHLNIFRFIYGLHGGPVEEVEDLTAETFTRAWRSRSSFTGDENAAIGWLFQIARNLVIDAHRRRQVRGDPVTLDEIQILSPELAPEEWSAEREDFARLWSALQSLPEEQCEMVVLRYLLNWQVKEIALLTGISENTVSVTLKRVLVKLRTRCKDEQVE